MAEKLETDYRCLSCKAVFARVDGPAGGPCPFCDHDYLLRLKPFPIIASSDATLKQSGTTIPDP